MAPKCFETFFSSRRAIPVFTLRGIDAAMRVLFLKRREQALNYRACGQSMISTGIKSVPREQNHFACGATHQTKLRHTSCRTYLLTHQASELSLSNADVAVVIGPCRH